MPALHLQPFVLAVDPQFLQATGAGDIVSSGRRGCSHADLRQGKETGNLDAVFGQLGIQQSTTGSAVDQSGWHIITALRARTARPFPVHG